MKKFFSSKRNRIIVICISLLIIIGIVTGLYLLKPVKKEEPPKKKKTKPKVIEKLKIVDEDSNKRPIAIMIDNNVGSSSHIGLQEAYITYEIVVEGGLSRMMAIYKDKETPEIGPVRSSRHYFLDYALESDCIYTHYGWSPFAENDIKLLGVNNLNGLYDNIPFWRSNNYRSPHNVFTSIAKIYEASDKKGYRKESNDWKLLNYQIKDYNLEEKYQEDSNVITANQVSFNYLASQSRSFTYNVENKYYLRTMNNEPHIDANTKEQYHYKNLILMKVNNFTLDNEGRQDLDTVGTGEGFYVTNGHAIPIQWSKSARNAKTQYIYKDEEININDGNTFIEIVPINNQIIIQ